jgi:hypothetical protein
MTSTTTRCSRWESVQRIEPSACACGSQRRLVAAVFTALANVRPCAYSTAMFSTGVGAVCTGVVEHPTMPLQTAEIRVAETIFAIFILVPF